ncbi:hypothetical protein GHT06_021143 [Daphnia sinensis]|uniref:Uncharacterized protein n=1 Tax=Daphnia sinensis TaxID=1820382 RepID=A0AAD5PNG6_9CRUS|nr:hypothetical protein GHT06_021143 [Daphnia sinensis]
MADINGRRVLELVKKPGNSVCADCNCQVTEYASYNIGVFLCTQCAGIHRALGTHISKIKHLRLDKWEESQVKHLEEVGNIVAKRKYEERVPVCYRRPSENDPQILREQWIRAKYQREEFIYAEKQRYTRGTMEGFLFKRSKVDDSCKQRRFVLSERENTLKYYVSNKKEPKAEIRILDMNVAFAPEKLKPPTSLQITYINQGSTRHIYVYHDDAEVIVEWYMAIRSAKLNLLQVAHPTLPEMELAQSLTQDFLKEGFLCKTGPKPSDGFKRRWFTLDGRKLMYHDQKLDPYPKGEIFIGHSSDGYSIHTGQPAGWKLKDVGFIFHVKTPSRSFVFSAERSDDRNEWIAALQMVISRPMSPQDSFLRGILVKKRGGGSVVSFFSTR